MSAHVLSLTHHPQKETVILNVPSSKSISNRLLLLKQTYNPNLNILNLSTTDDTQLLLQLISKIKTANMEEITELNTENCGTAFRFLCAFLCFQKGKWLLTGNNAMKNRPVKGLVDVLTSCGAIIRYTEKEGFPPLEIKGLDGLHVKDVLTIDSQKSSQFVSAILLILPLLKKDITILFDKNTSSVSYLQMTIALMQHVGINISCQDNCIKYSYTIASQQTQNVMVESDWSAAAYWFAWAALHPNSTVFINKLQKSNLQVDKIIEDIVKQCGVEVNYQKEGVSLRKTSNKKPLNFHFDARSCLDLVPTLVVLCCGLNIKATITGIENLVYKESNRLAALISELEKIADIQYVENNLLISSSEKQNDFIPHFQTYNDHRLAMSFALFIGIFPEILIENPDCVSKSYPEFWENLEKLGVKTKK